jgi:hypothetical protein
VKSSFAQQLVDGLWAVVDGLPSETRLLVHNLRFTFNSRMPIAPQDPATARRTPLLNGIAPFVGIVRPLRARRHVGGAADSA